MNNFRIGAILIILVAFAGGSWSRFYYSDSRDVASSVTSAIEVGRTLENSELRVTGSFEEPMGDLSLMGYEVSLPTCSAPLAVLPIPVKNSAIPNTYRYSEEEYNSSYIYNGTAYPESGISYRLRSLHILYSIQALLGLMKHQQFAFYLKVWTPPGCPMISASQAVALERGLTAKSRS